MPTCESCGREQNGVTKVQRVYLVVDDADTDRSPADIEASATPTAGDIELWCASCCATFPHTIVTDD